MASRYSINKFKYLSEPEQEDLTTILKKFPGRDATLLLLLLYTGGRASEVLNIRTEDLNTHDKSVFIRGLKDSNDREIPLPNWLFDLLVLESRKVSSGAVFKISYTRLRQIWMMYRPVPKKLHSLRHTFAIGVFKRTKDLRLVQVALGHRNIQNTLVYSEYLYSQEELRKLLIA